MTIDLMDIFFALLLVSLGAFWWHTNAVRESALRQVKQHCQKLELQLLDESVALKKWRIVWSTGQLAIKREFIFEFTSTGEARYLGDVVFIGRAMIKVTLSAYHI